MTITKWQLMISTQKLLRNRHKEVQHGYRIFRLSEINGPLVALEGIKDAAYDEIVEFKMNDGEEKRLGRIIEINEDKAVIQVFEGSEGMSLTNTHTKLTGHPMEVALSPDILGRTFRYR